MQIIGRASPPELDIAISTAGYRLAHVPTAKERPVNLPPILGETSDRTREPGAKLANRENLNHVCD